MSDNKIVVVLLGKPGAGKGTQGIKLSQRNGWAHISTGDLLREEMQQTGEVADQLKAIMGSGQLVSPEIVVPILYKKIQSVDSAGVILDGFPRNHAQAQLLESHDVKVTHVVYFDIQDDVVVQRLSGRLMHKPSGRVYHEVNQPPKVTGLDDVTGEPLVRRVDDQPDVIRNRLKVYADETLPLLDYYRSKEGVQLYHLEVTGKSIDEVSTMLMSCFQVKA